MGRLLAQGITVMAILATVAGAGACNLITGAEGLEIEGDGDGDGEGGAGGEDASGAGAGSPTGQGDSGAGSGPTASGSGAAGGGAPGPACGDGACDAGESCAVCAQDCGQCESCGDGLCGDGETCDTCAQDCGQCDPCGNGLCDAGEACDTCASDCGACSTCGGAGDATTALDAEEQAFLQILNQYRAENGLGPLTACTSLNRTAQGHSEDMRDNNYFDHEGLNGSSPWDRACDACYQLGCGPSTAMAENIAAGNSGAQATFMQWKNSPGHNSNMLGANFEVIGIGRATGGGQYGVYWTNVFGGSTEASCN